MPLPPAKKSHTGPGKRSSAAASYVCSAITTSSPFSVRQGVAGRRCQAAVPVICAVMKAASRAMPSVIASGLWELHESRN
ncbi:hypothetical protein GCM10015534_30740 [Streptomyces diastaticus subsp. diastaticus]|uniref:Uncharacterized protein n=1 Tax=Streptomyces gougerotii TaxID=53448 RepID=A0A8H9LX17_9ACTN|nr:hypothetical protein Srut_56530 [Streptomyces rutgersensis]GGU25945.1 hypothetical protein GCM10015534_30740 [Streptomyces diastaticus subsp. diastaticus]GGU91666.1 hypothetical protein GCM10010227_53690 [Streptomyces gougerotii]